MDIDAEVLAELKSIRQTQEEILAEYRQGAKEALDVQRQAIETQLKAVAQQSEAIALSVRNSRIWRTMIACAGVLMIWLVWFIYRHGG